LEYKKTWIIRKLFGDGVYYLHDNFLRKLSLKSQKFGFNTVSLDTESLKKSKFCICRYRKSNLSAVGFTEIAYFVEFCNCNNRILKIIESDMWNVVA